MMATRESSYHGVESAASQECPLRFPAHARSLHPSRALPARHYPVAMGAHPDGSNPAMQHPRWTCPPRQPPSSHCKEVSLLDTSGTIVGGIRINNTSSVDATDMMLSLVLLSRSITASRPLNSWEMPETAVFHADCLPFCFISPQCLAEDRFIPYDFYNVMWVGW